MFDTTPKVNEGRNLKVIRETRGHMQKYAAKELGVSQPYIAKLESMEKVPDDMLVKLAQLYKVDVELIKQLNIDTEKISITMHDNTFGDGNNIGKNEIEIAEQHNIYNTDERIIKLCEEKDRQIELLFATLQQILETDRLQREEMTNLLKSKK